MISHLVISASIDLISRASKAVFSHASKRSSKFWIPATDGFFYSFPIRFLPAHLDRKIQFARCSVITTVKYFEISEKNECDIKDKTDRQRMCSWYPHVHFSPMTNPLFEFAGRGRGKLIGRAYRCRTDHRPRIPTKPGRSLAISWLGLFGESHEGWTGGTDIEFALIRHPRCGSKASHAAQKLPPVSTCMACLRSCPVT